MATLSTSDYSNTTKKSTHIVRDVSLHDNTTPSKLAIHRFIDRCYHPARNSQLRDWWIFFVQRSILLHFVEGESAMNSNLHICSLNLILKACGGIRPSDWFHSFPTFTLWLVVCKLSSLFRCNWNECASCRIPCNWFEFVMAGRGHGQPRKTFINLVMARGHNLHATRDLESDAPEAWWAWMS